MDGCVDRSIHSGSIDTRKVWKLSLPKSRGKRGNDTDWTSQSLLIWPLGIICQNVSVGIYTVILKTRARIYLDKVFLSFLQMAGYGHSCLDCRSEKRESVFKRLVSLRWLTFDTESFWNGSSKSRKRYFSASSHHVTVLPYMTNCSAIANFSSQCKDGIS